MSTSSLQLLPMGNPYLSYEPGALLFDLAFNLSPRVWHERSLAVREASVNFNRFLLTVKVAQITGGVREKLRAVCRHMRMPAGLLEIACTHLHATRFFAFGFEQSAKGNIYKVYLEQNTPRGTPLGQANSTHFGFKWDAANPARYILTEYIWYPGLSLADIHQRVEGVYPSEADTHARAIAQELIDFAGQQITKRFGWLEVVEVGNKRRSFDVNLYDAGLRIAQIKSFLLRMWNHYGLDAEKWDEFFESSQAEGFGHLSGGLHRNGKDFFNVYFGRKVIFGCPKVVTRPLMSVQGSTRRA